LGVLKEEDMKFKILIDATTIENKKDGLSQYIIAIINHLPESSFEIFDYTILINPGIKKEELNHSLQSGKFTILTKKIAPIGPRREWDMFWFLLKSRNQFDLFHSTSNQYPLFLKKGIATVHDITFKKYLDSKWWTFNLAKRYLHYVIRNALSSSVAVIVVSEATKKELSLYYKTSAINDKIRVIYEGWEHLLPYKTDPQISTNGYNPGHYLFYIGSSRLHKNLRRLINAFVIASNQLAVDIKLSGDKQHLNTADQEIVNKLNKNGDRIVFTGFLSDSELAFYLKNADGFIFPSLNEGFGLPVLESFFYNKPLLCSNTSSLPEIAGDAALYFDPENIEDMARTIVFFYQNPAKWPLMIEKGKQRLTYFSWKKTTVETVALYKEILLDIS
jgi:glycosyltransferase involved in cell wall biosynthesis